MARPGSRWTALVAGATLPLAFAPFEFFWVAPLTLAALFSIWLACKDLRSTAVTGFLFGVGQFGVGASWIQVSIQQFGGVNLPLSILMTLLFVAGMALFIMAAGVMFHLLGRKPLFLPVIWVLFEWIRSTILGGFPWLLLGHTAPGTFYSGLAPLAGTFGVSLFLSSIAVLLVVITKGLTRRTVTIMVMSTLMLLAWGSSQIRWGEPAGEPLTVALIQGNIKQSEKWLPQHRDKTLGLYQSKTEQATDARLVIWPETAVPAFHHQIAEGFLAPLGEKLEIEGRTLLTGIPIQTDQDGGYVNGMIQLGAESGEYYKRHLVPFGEYLPMRNILGPVLDFIQIPLSDFKSGGEDQLPLSVAGHQLSTTICYEVAYPDLTFSNLPEAELLVTISNDGWFGDSLAPYQHLQIARMRALESARPMLRATNTGITAVIDHNGMVTKQLPRSEKGTLNAVIQPMKSNTPYLSWAY